MLRGAEPNDLRGTTSLGSQATRWGTTPGANVHVGKAGAGPVAVVARASQPARETPLARLVTPKGHAWTEL